jgi:hypothetical protein
MLRNLAVSCVLLVSIPAAVAQMTHEQETVQAKQTIG